MREIRSFFAILKIQTIASLQFRISLIGRVSTNVFWGIIHVVLMYVFYTYGSKSDGGINSGMNMNQAISYAWLVQIAMALNPGVLLDNSVWEKIRNGDVGTELCRPLSLYLNWYAQAISKKLSPFLVSVIPVTLIAFIFPAPYGLLLPNSFLSFCAFAVSLCLGLFLSCALSAFAYPMLTNIKWGTGPVYMYLCLIDVFSGSFFPLQLWPKSIQKIVYFLPTAGVTDLPFRFYTGTLGIDAFLSKTMFQIVWIIALFAVGNMWLHHATKKIVIQGG